MCALEKKRKQGFETLMERAMEIGGKGSLVSNTVR